LVKTGQFTAKCKDNSYSSKTANITLIRLNLERYACLYQQNHVSVDGSKLYWYCYNGHFYSGYSHVHSKL